ncbi:MAG: hypothetical protein L6Q81_04085 [Bacteroidia bacterium]|nr:hypothetical protein [Bacteroidia bacterium]
MRIVALIIAHLLGTFAGYCQTQLLKNYDFDKGGYYILGVYSEADRNGLRDSIGEFYTDSIPILNQFKQEWTFDQPSPRYACGYHYTVYICKDGLPIEHFFINLNCNVIVSGKSCFYFDAHKLRVFKGKLKRPIRKNDKFESIKEARTKRSEILTQPKLITTFTPNWMKFEGEFSFTYSCPAGSNDCLSQDDSLLQQLALEIQSAYPEEIFELQSAGGSSTELFVNVRCNKTLADKFKLYPLSWNKWEAYPLYLTSYWVPM